MKTLPAVVLFFSFSFSFFLLPRRVCLVPVFFDQLSASCCSSFHANAKLREREREREFLVPIAFCLATCVHPLALARAQCDRWNANKKHETCERGERLWRAEERREACASRVSRASFRGSMTVVQTHSGRSIPRRWYRGFFRSPIGNATRANASSTTTIVSRSAVLARGNREGKSLVLQRELLIFLRVDYAAEQEGGKRDFFLSSA